MILNCMELGVSGSELGRYGQGTDHTCYIPLPIFPPFLCFSSLASYLSPLGFYCASPSQRLLLGCLEPSVS